MSLCEALDLGSTPEAVLGPLRGLYSQVDAHLARASRGLDLPCRAGCSDCCYEAVFVSAPELLLVAEALFEAPRVRRAAVVDAMVAIAGRFEDELELLETLEPGPERDEVAARIKFRCPLLGSDERCGVYAARELNGRTFGQTRDGRRGEPYGCAKTHAHLRVLPERSRGLPDARDFRRQLTRAVPGTAFVHVYPWWFARHREHLID